VSKVNEVHRYSQHAYDVYLDKTELTVFSMTTENINMLVYSKAY